MNIIKNGFKNERLGIELDVYIIDGKEWFRAKDISDFLEYRDARDMVRIVSFNENINTHIVPNVVNPRGTTFINEFALYEVVCKINKTDIERYNKAREFQQWVFSEVLPSLRKNNFYIDSENIDNSQLKDLQLKLIDITQQRDNFSNGLLYSPNKRQVLKPFIENMFPKCENVYSQFLDNMVKSGMLDDNFQPTDIFRKTNSTRRMFIHTNKTTVDTVVDLVVTNVGMDELYRRLYVEDNVLKIKKYEPKIDILKLF